MDNLETPQQISLNCMGKVKHLKESHQVQTPVRAYRSVVRFEPPTEEMWANNAYNTLKSQRDHSVNIIILLLKSTNIKMYIATLYILLINTKEKQKTEVRQS